LDVAQVVGDSVPTQPLIFVLSTGVDPTKNLLDLAEKKGMKDRMKSLSLGQGQAPIAEKMIELARAEGHWVFLANAHLSLSWMPRLAKIVETMETEAPHPDFRLWLSSSPTPAFPISILQAGIKMTTEPPKGIRANMKRLYASLTEEQFERCDSTVKYKKLLLGLAFFHSILIERRKFQMLGWNVAYPFNDSDFIICESLLSLYLEEYATTPWDALRYLISGVMYGGHITDDWDRRLVLVYIADLFTEDALTDGYQLSAATEYFVQPHGDMTSYVDYLGALPAVDPPGAFGQHPNADISSMIREAGDMLSTLVGLQVRIVSSCLPPTPISPSVSRALFFRRLAMLQTSPVGFAPSCCTQSCLLYNIPASNILIELPC
jgi:dynein heavy chain, axonemal